MLGDVISLASFREARRASTADAPAVDPETAWSKAGAQLREVDPARFEMILRLARQIIETHRNPVGRGT